MNPQILHQTDDYWILAKPPGWLTIPGRAARGEEPLPVLSTWLSKESGMKTWIVHRIDTETSGLLLMAKNAEFHRTASIWFEKNQVEKRYLFIAQGNPRQPVMRLDTPVEGKASRTQIEVKERFEGIPAFYGMARLVTGRRHQIRVQLSENGNPIWGDVKYKGLREPSPLFKDHRIERVALHSAEMKLPTGEKFAAPLPSDFSAWLERARGKA